MEEEAENSNGQTPKMKTGRPNSKNRKQEQTSRNQD